MTRKEYQVARGFFRIDMARPNGEVDEDFDELIKTNVVRNHEMPWDVRVVIREGIPASVAIDMLKAIVVSLIEEGYLFGCDNLHLG